MDDVTDMHAAAVQTEEHAPAAVETADAQAVVVAATEHAADAQEHETPPAPAAPHLVTLDDYCAAKSKRLHGHIELIAAFNTLETRKHNLLATTEDFDAAFDALRARPAK